MAQAVLRGATTPERYFSIITTTEFASFHRFREGSSEVFNAGGNDAFIHNTTMFIDYGVTQHSVVSIMLPYVRKIQFTNRFGIRAAENLGDIAIFGRHEVIKPCRHGCGPSVWGGLGLKFPTGEIDDPNDLPRLPPPFQTGSGAYDLIPTLQYYQNFDKHSLFGNAFIRFPLEANELGYEFGNEYELHFGINYPLPILGGDISLLLSLDYLYAEHDKAFQTILPPRLLDGVKVLNTGGSFLDLTPGFSVRLTKKATVTARMFLPVAQDWNGDRTRTPPVGQVATDITGQITLVTLF
jgi:hypothetical protein